MNDTTQRVLLLSEIFPPKTGGSGRWFHEIYSRLPSQNVVIAAGVDPRADSFDATHAMNVERLPLNMPEWGIRNWAAARQYWSLFRQLKSVIRRDGISTVHCGRCLPEGWLAFLLKKLCGVPYISYVHGEDVESASTSRELTWMAHRILGGADFLIANSRNSASLLIENWNVDPSRVRVLHPGVDSHRFVPAERDEAVRESLGWEDRTVVLTVGRLQKRKGHDVMIQALPKIRESVPDILFAIIGDGEERAEIERLIAEHNVPDHVQVLGEVDDSTMISCYQQCDLFALPNRQVGRDIEGFGMVLVEAQSCARAVLAGASGGTRETMRIGET
ncbi:MAG: glycosyltransferase family 4 protein, partial [Planctomycetota bacterium]